VSWIDPGHVTGHDFGACRQGGYNQVLFFPSFLDNPVFNLIFVVNLKQLKLFEKIGFVISL